MGSKGSHHVEDIPYQVACLFIIRQHYGFIHSGGLYLDDSKNRSKLTIPTDKSYGSVVCAYVRSIAEKMGFDAEQLQMIELGVDEAFSNVVKHGYDFGEDTFDVICEKLPFGIKITLKEKGMPFDPSRIPKFDPNAKLEDITGEGLGTFLIEQSMDEVHYNNLGKEGKETQLIKHIRDKTILDYFDKEDMKWFEKPEKKKVRKKRKIEYDVRLMKPNEALDISKCVYQTYGYSYDKEDLYYPDRIEVLNQIGLMESAIAVVDGEMASHAALYKDKQTDKVAEMGTAVTKPKFRGQGMMNNLVTFLMDKAKDEGMIGLYGQAMGNHPFSQKAILKQDLRDTGFLLGSVPTTRKFKGFSEQLTGRGSVIIMFKYLNKPESLELFAPPRYRVIIENIYNNLGVIPTFSQPPEDIKFDDNPSKLATKVYAGKASAFIKVKKIGIDVVNEIQKQLKELLMKKMDVVYLYISLEDPHTPEVAEGLEWLGFVFCGVFPGLPFGDCAIFTYLNDVAINMDKIVTVSDMAAEIKEHIKEANPDLS